ncbi:MAG TPA: hypothetical protein VLC98_06365 [Phnomibacter sp.]|nr:hypothetical protein [Phnomibacter sp.]
MKSKSLALLTGIISWSCLHTQPINIPIHNFISQQTERDIPDSAMPAFSSIRPYQGQWLKPWMNVYAQDTTRKGQRWLNGHLIRYNDDQFTAWIDPILSLNGGYTNREEGGTYQNSRGVQAGMLLGKTVGIGFAFTENQSSFPQFVDDFMSANHGVIPGQGMARGYKDDGYDYAFSDAYLRWAPGKVFSATLGYGQNFLGEGYRSLFLSDNSFNYPFLQLDLNLKRLHYTVLYNNYQNVNYTMPGGSYQRKWSTIHYLTVKLGKRWNVGLYDAVMWQAEDSSMQRGFDFAYLNPIPFLRPIEFSRGSPDNMLLGLHGKYRVTKGTYLYTQIMLDDINIQASRDSGEQHLNNKYAIQLGGKSFTEWLGAKWMIRGEYNYSRPYVYGHRKPAQSYTNYQQALAHPLNANFHEAIAQIMVSKGRWYLDNVNQLAVVGREDPATPYNDGNDLFGGEDNVPTFGATTLQGIRTPQLTTQWAVGWVLNPRWNMAIEGSVLYKRVSPENLAGQQTVWFRLGLTTRLRNMYLDF